MKKFLFAALSLLTASLSLAAVNINTASPSELEALPGIGPAKAKAIVDYRQQHGAFKSVEELKNVKGIGEGIFSKLKAEATVAPCGGLLVFAQIISDIKKRRNLGKTWISAFFAFEKSCISFFTKPRGNARFFVESCRVLIGF